MAVRRNDDIAQEWRAVALSNATWTRAINQSGGPSGGVRVGEAGGMMGESDSLPMRRVYMKPSWRAPDQHDARAAREKIASDLARDLGFAVPPVILANRANPPNVRIQDAFGRVAVVPGEERVCVSLVMFQRQFSWEELYRKLEASTPSTKNPAVRALIENARETLPAAASHALAFDTWVGQMDHHPRNNHNIIFGYELSRRGDVTSYSYVFLDYALSFGIGGRWRTPGHAERAEICNPAPLHPMMLAAVTPDGLSHMIRRIEDLPTEVIDNVVRRIPTTHLPENEKDAIVTGLNTRRALLRGALDSYLR